MLDILIKSSYLLAAALFIIGLQRMSSPKTARSGIVWAGFGMLLAVFASFFLPDMHNLGLIILAMAIGTVLAWVSGKKVAMTDMPQMVALYNGMGGGSAAAIGMVALLTVAAGGDTGHPWNTTTATLAVLGSLIGTVSFSGSIIAFAKLQGLMKGQFIFSGQKLVNGLIFLAAVLLGLWQIFELNTTLIVLFFVLALVFGVAMTLPIGGADMPVVISLYNAFTGLAVSFEGYVLQNESMIIAGMLVGAAGMLLTQLMAKAMNRSLTNVLFSNFGAGGGAGGAVEGSMKETTATDAAVMMAYAERVVIVPGYGMAVAQAQHKIMELTQQLLDRGVKVKFAIHPVAGRMPGHMNVLLAEAGVPYDLIEDLEDINPEFPNTDVVLVIGANDVVNPQAKEDPSSPIYGMPILEADQAKNVIVIKRGRGTGFAGIENTLFYKDNTRMLFGDAQEVANSLVQEVKQL